MADAKKLPDRATTKRRKVWVKVTRQVAQTVYHTRCDQHRLADTFAVNGHQFAFLANNHPYTDHPHRRAAEHAAFRDWAFAAGVRVLAEESYPRAGEDAGYTCVLVLDLDLDPSDPAEAETFALCLRLYRKMIGSAAAAAHEERLAK